MLGVLDIDCLDVDGFSEKDARQMEQMAAIICEHTRWPAKFY